MRVARAITRAQRVVCGNDTHLSMSLSRTPAARRERGAVGGRREREGGEEEEGGGRKDEGREGCRVYWVVLVFQRTPLGLAGISPL